MSVKSFLKGLATGAVVGAAVGVTAGLLNAPKSGKELRKDLVKYGEEMKLEVEKLLAKSKKVSKDVYHNAVAEVTELYNKVKDFDKKDLEHVKVWLLDQWKVVEKKYLNK